MRILLVNDNGFEVGGAETYLVNLKNELIKRGHTVKVMVSEPKDKSKSFGDYFFKGVNQQSKVRVLPYIFNLNSYLSIRKIINEFKPDIVHLNFIFYHTSPSVIISLKNIPTIMTTHAHEAIAPVGIPYTEKCNHPFVGYCVKCTGFKYIPEKIKRLYFKIFVNNINTFISPSKYYAKLYTKAGYKPVRHLYNGINLTTKYSSINTATQNLLFVGRLAPEKGAKHCILAMPIILKKFPKAKLVIVGDGPEYEELKNLINTLSLQTCVRLVGKVDNRQTKKYYNNATIVLVTPTYPDNLPTVCIESMIAGKPIVGSKIGGIPELVDDKKTGFLVKSGDHKQIAEKVIKLFSNTDLLKQFSLRAKEKSNEFDIKRHINELEIIYRSVIK